MSHRFLIALSIRFVKHHQLCMILSDYNVHVIIQCAVNKSFPSYRLKSAADDFENIIGKISIKKYFSAEIIVPKVEIDDNEQLLLFESRKLHFPKVVWRKYTFLVYRLAKEKKSENLKLANMKL